MNNNESNGDKQKKILGRGNCLICPFPILDLSDGTGWGGGEWILPSDSLMGMQCHWMASRFSQLLWLYWDYLFSRLIKVGLHIFGIFGVRKFWPFDCPQVSPKPCFPSSPEFYPIIPGLVIQQNNKTFKHTFILSSSLDSSGALPCLYLNKQTSLLNLILLVCLWQSRTLGLTHILIIRLF